MVLLRFFWLSLRTLFSGLNPNTGKLSIANKTLFRKHSFKIPDSSKKDKLICFKYLYKSLRLLTSKNNSIQYRGNDKLIYDGNNQNKSQRVEYISKNINCAESSIDYLNVGSLKGVGFLKAFFFNLLFSVLYLPLLLISFFHPYRHILALYILSSSQAYILLNLLIKNEIKKVYYFFPFENDANFNALILMAFNIKVVKMPGPNSLFRFHKYMLSDEVIFNSAYQVDQYEVLKENWKVTNVELWPIYGFHSLLLFFNKKTEYYRYDVGFISSGIWRREELGLQAFEVGDYKSEKTLINWLNDFFMKNKVNQLFIYLHPIEKNNIEIYKRAVEFYKKKFKNCKLFFGDYKLKSFEEFKYVNVTISAQSTSNLQRLFCGYKAIYTPMKFVNPVFNNSRLENICYSDKGRFFEGLNNAIKNSEENFFKQNELQKFHHNYYNLL